MMSYAITKLEDVLDRFCDGAESVKEYVYAERDYIDSYSAANSLRAAAKRFGKRLKVSCRNGHVYMIKVR